jgi:hypothetical protein
MRNAFAGFLVLASLVLFILSVVYGLFNLTLYGAPAGLFFAAGCVFMGLAIVFRVRGTR